MEISKISFTGTKAPELRKKDAIKDNKAIANQTDVVSKDANSAIRNMAMANICRTMSVKQAGNEYNIEGKYKIVGEQTTEESNNYWKSIGYTDAPYKPNQKAQIIELTKDTKFVRTYDGENSGMYGSWIM